MGVEGLAKLLRPSNEAPDNLEELRGKRVGVDLFIVLYPALRGQTVDQFHAKPPVPTTAVLNKLGDFFDLFIAAGATPVVVVDGRNHPLKETVSSLRQQAVSDAEAELEVLYANGRASRVERREEASKESYVHS